jgi:hypothetical protein
MSSVLDPAGPVRGDVLDPLCLTRRVPDALVCRREDVTATELAVIGVTLVDAEPVSLKLVLNASGAACLTFQRPTAPPRALIDAW